MKVIGAGYGRTGTKSLQLALEKLGFGKCYHMEELFRHPHGVYHWENAMEGKKVKWDELFEGYQSVVDFPASMYYKELLEYYPEAKIILGVRDPERWYHSAYQTIYSVDPGIYLKLRIGFRALYKQRAKNILRIGQMIDKAVWQKFFEGRFEDKEYTIEKYNQHIASVKEEIAPERLLVHNAADGWEPLCEFLNKEVPHEPYPRTNQSQDFQSYTREELRESLYQK